MRRTLEKMLGWLDLLLHSCIVDLGFRVGGFFFFVLLFLPEGLLKSTPLSTSTSTSSVLVLLVLPTVR
jgi:hypothetical protein